MDSTAVTAEEVETIQGQADELVRRVREGTLPFGATSATLQALIVSAASVEDRQAKQRDLAEECRAEIEKSLRARGHDVNVPKPVVNGVEVSNREFDRRKKLKQGLFFHAATRDVTHEAFMASHGQSDHWTVTDEAERAKIQWEPAAEGYWFWAEIAPSCPRLKTCWNDLTKSLRLLSLEEYVVVWWTHFDLTGQRLDVPTWSWLRTRYRIDEETLGALRAYEYYGRVSVRRTVVGHLAYAYGHEGGRCSEVVTP